MVGRRPDLFGDGERTASANFWGRNMTSTADKSMMILIAGPYRSGTNDDAALIRKNVQQMESYALPLFRAGHIPILGEWLALPLADLAGSRQIGDAGPTEVLHAVAVRMLDKCDSVLGVGGVSAGGVRLVPGRRRGVA